MHGDYNENMYVKKQFQTGRINLPSEGFFSSVTAGFVLCASTSFFCGFPEDCTWKSIKFFPKFHGHLKGRKRRMQLSYSESTYCQQRHSNFSFFFVLISIFLLHFLKFTPLPTANFFPSWLVLRYGLVGLP